MVLDWDSTGCLIGSIIQLSYTVRIPVFFWKSSKTPWNGKSWEVRGANKRVFPGKGMDIFWNHTIRSFGVCLQINCVVTKYPGNHCFMNWDSMVLDWDSTGCLIGFIIQLSYTVRIPVFWLADLCHMILGCNETTTLMSLHNSFGWLKVWQFVRCRHWFSYW